MGYNFQEFSIPEHMLESLRAYIDSRRPPGSFLRAVLDNDLAAAMRNADDHNLRNLPAYSAYLYNEAPMPCYGSPEKVLAWLANPAPAGGDS